MDLAAYVSLFLSAFLAATIIPAQSEALLVLLITHGAYSVVALIIVASVGNILGSIVNWWLGQRLESFRHKKWFPVKEKNLDKAQKLYMAYGRWLLLLSWVPIIGDPITMAAGILREKFAIFLLLVSISKISRYLVIAYLVLHSNT